MKYSYCLLFSIGFQLITNAQTYEEEIRIWQEELNTEYKTKGESPLSEADRLAFEGHEFYPIDSSWNILATWVRDPDSAVFSMPTSGRPAAYRKYAQITFTIQADTFHLIAYQNMRLKDMPEYTDYLFLPFGDWTNGTETYGGGRYLDVRLTSEEFLRIDFNKSYNPYCAYSSRYSCPIVPENNKLNIAVTAGIKLENDH